MILLLLSFLIPLSARGGKILQLNITELSFSYNLIVNIGGETRKYFEISLQTNFTFAASHNYKPLTFNKLGESYMSIKKEKDILFDILSSPLELILTNQSDDKIIIEDFNYYYYQGHLRRYDSFGFAYRMADRKSSLLYQLYDMGSIDEVKFGFRMEKNNSKGYLFLGGVPEEKIKGLEKKTCSVNKTYYYWGCALNSVKVGSLFDFNVNGYSRFSVEASNILVPKRFFKKLKEEFLDEFLRKNLCFVRFDEYFCQEGVEKIIPDFTFKFEDMEIRLSNREIFEYKVHLRKFLITENEEDEWVFGIRFIDQFVTLFDYDNSTVSFYPLYTEKDKSLSSNSIIKILFLFNSLVLSGLCCGLLLFRMNQHKFTIKI